MHINHRRNRDTTHPARRMIHNFYAVGDCAELNGTIAGLWLASKDQGEAVADIIAGKISEMPPKTYRPKPKLPSF